MPRKQEPRPALAAGSTGAGILTLVVALLMGACTPPEEPLPEIPDERVSNLEIVSTVKVPEDAERVRIWVPLPQDNAYQQIRDLEVEGPGEPVFTVDPSEGNRLAYFDLEGHRGPVEIRTRFTMRRQERDALGAPGPSPSESKGADPQADLEPERLVPITETIARLAEEQTAGATDPLGKARGLYDWCVRNMSYDKSGEGWGRGDAIWACNAKRGNCTDFHSVFMAMARSEEIPARFVMGFPLPPDQEEGEVGGYHCWAEFHHPEKGWVPIDASEAAKHPEMKEYYFGRLTPDRVVVSTGRDLRLEPAHEGEPLNFLWEPYAEADGEPIEEVDTVLRFRPA